MSSITVSLSEDFADYEWEVEAKGWFPEASITVSGVCYHLVFYDAVRLSQDIESELERGVVFFEPNLVIVRSVTRSNMNQAVELLVRTGRVALLAPWVSGQ